MGVEHIPIRDELARELAASDIATFTATVPPGFRVERTQMRLQAALANGLSEREAQRLGEIADLPGSPWVWRRFELFWSSLRARIALGVVASAAAGVAVWLAVGSSGPLSSSQWLAAEQQILQHRLDDGSSIELSAGAAGQLNQGDETVHFALHQGLATFDVVPERQRLWRVSAGDYGVTVVGTRFSVLYDPAGSFEVVVQRGEVAVEVPTQTTALSLVAGASLIATNESVTLRHEGGTEAPVEPLDTTEPPTNVGDDIGEDGRAGDESLSEVNEARPLGQRSAEVSRAGRPPTRSEQHTRLGELRLLSRARQEIAAGNNESALALTQKHKRQFPAGQLAEEREALRVKALRGMGREQDARKAASEFRERFPKSVLSPQMPATEDE